MTGQNRILILFLIALFLSGCGLFGWDEPDDYWYIVRIKNDTDISLTIVLGEERIADTLEISPKSFADCKGLKVSKNQNVITEVLFEGGDRTFEERIRIYSGDQLRVDWKGPVEEKGITHHFYNYNSWESWLIDNSNDGIVQFTIYESDL